MLTFSKYENPTYNDEIDPKRLIAAQILSYRYAGLCEFTIRTNKSLGQWEAEFSVACGTRFRGTSTDINEAIDLSVYLLEKYYQWGRDDQ